MAFRDLISFRYLIIHVSQASARAELLINAEKALANKGWPFPLAREAGEKLAANRLFDKVAFLWDRFEDDTWRPKVSKSAYLDMRLLTTRSGGQPNTPRPAGKRVYTPFSMSKRTLCQLMLRNAW